MFAVDKNIVEEAKSFITENYNTLFLKDLNVEYPFHTCHLKNVSNGLLNYLENFTFHASLCGKQKGLLLSNLTAQQVFWSALFILLS